MPFAYLPVMAQSSAPKPPRVAAAPAKIAWQPMVKPVSRSRVALLTSAALRLADHAPSDPGAGAIVIDHHSGIGRVPREDPEIVFPRTALAALAARAVIGAVAP